MAKKKKPPVDLDTFIDELIELVEENPPPGSPVRLLKTVERGEVEWVILHAEKDLVIGYYSTRKEAKQYIKNCMLVEV